ncbi:uncharacterized protein BO96DRAFT_340147 [Aspergillus niger CBS 101883]|uniref:Contig An12c0090, genomic contig n=3 Tax=Aspergillus niger TaxID=5061 RepID=A2QZ30_ASPNC|nr:uncharacterized protein BO96DRAFT_340147 [Aspergillus niger CBS 101883]XP_059604395.1 uncharacterized protein An12g03420 [Aspergillus niger]PYH55634.1 hypothetical protein BO96DRAFT_340147 [Aspergillus niger CBS 101883]RDH16497.1 hypothetical protein M747DRAFT_317819 [Aspergillus niger ATCC 13496]CAK46115.1 unnamed protein product [Aspergillus niger]
MLWSIVTTMKVPTPSSWESKLNELYKSTNNIVSHDQDDIRVDASELVIQHEKLPNNPLKPVPNKPMQMLKGSGKSPRSAKRTAVEGQQTFSIIRAPRKYSMSWFSKHAIYSFNDQIGSPEDRLQRLPRGPTTIVVVLRIHAFVVREGRHLEFEWTLLPSQKRLTIFRSSWVEDKRVLVEWRLRNLTGRELDLTDWRPKHTENTTRYSCRASLSYGIMMIPQQPILFTTCRVMVMKRNPETNYDSETDFDNSTAARPLMPLGGVYTYGTFDYQYPGSISYQINILVNQHQSRLSSVAFESVVQMGMQNHGTDLICSMNFSPTSDAIGKGVHILACPPNNLLLEAKALLDDTRVTDVIIMAAIPATMCTFSMTDYIITINKKVTSLSSTISQIWMLKWSAAGRDQSNATALAGVPFENWTSPA